jgi:hypothetical protein
MLRAIPECGNTGKINIKMVKGDNKYLHKLLKKKKRLNAW